MILNKDFDELYNQISIRLDQAILVRKEAFAERSRLVRMASIISLVVTVAISTQLYFPLFQNMLLILFSSENAQLLINSDSFGILIYFGLFTLILVPPVYIGSLFAKYVLTKFNIPKNFQSPIITSFFLPVWLLAFSFVLSYFPYPAPIVLNPYNFAFSMSILLWFLTVFASIALINLILISNRTIPKFFWILPSNILPLPETVLPNKILSIVVEDKKDLLNKISIEDCKSIVTIGSTQKSHLDSQIQALISSTSTLVVIGILSTFIDTENISSVITDIVSLIIDFFDIEQFNLYFDGDIIAITLIFIAVIIVVTFVVLVIFTALGQMYLQLRILEILNLTCDNIIVEKQKERDEITNKEIKELQAFKEKQEKSFLYRVGKMVRIF